MGKIIETTYHESVSDITEFGSKLINNSFYMLNDKKPSIVTYYNINKEKSTLDPGSKLAYDNLGKDSPIRYNKITDFLIYGFNRIELQTENDEFGLEGEKITGDCYVLPNTITPTEGDYFEVNHIKDSTWLFLVTDVQQDTLKNGSNVYKLQYKLEYVDNSKIQENVVENFKLIEVREGTNVSRVVLSDKYEKAKKMDELAVQLKELFNCLFYNEKVQTFTYMDLSEWRMYDPFMIEFLIRNKILDNGLDSFVYVCHQLQVPNTFGIDYNETIYRAFEKKSRKLLSKALYSIIPEDIVSYGTTFSSRFETYFKTKYIDNQLNSTNVISTDLIYQIIDNKLCENDIDETNEQSKTWINILIKYFDDVDYSEDELESLKDYRFCDSYEAFYLIPLLILCLESSIEKLLNCEHLNKSEKIY